MGSTDRGVQLNSNELARKIVEIIEEKQAADIVLLDVSEQTSITTYFVLGSVDNERQANAIRDDLWDQLQIEQKMRPLNVHDLRQEGGGWLLADYGDVILHLFTEETRSRYDLEGLWSDAHVILKIL
ncbi:MAG: ribosome silencing factor [Caldilineaceae bacterium]|nr:ribosome silencing factor [Caldilineaceae bacterium]MDE0337332.1 ribosome silencing factor [Caldilineaceae bacterium]